METLHDALLKRMGNVGLEKVLSASMLVESANRVLPPEFCAKTFKNDCLTIETATSASAYFFKQDSETYLERINAALSNPVVKQLRLRIKHT